MVELYSGPVLFSVASMFLSFDDQVRVLAFGGWRIRSLATLLGVAGPGLAQSPQPIQSTSSQPRVVSSTAHVTLQLDSTRSVRFDARAFDLGVTQASARDAGPTPASSAELVLTKP